MELSEFVDRVVACEGARELQRLLISAFSDLGAVAISGYKFPYGGAASTGDREPIVSTFPEAVSNAYRAQMAGEDPIMYAAMTLGAPFHFLKIESSLYLTARAAAVIQVMRDCGLRDGVATPVFAKPAAYGYFAAAFDKPRPDLTQADLRRMKFLFSEFFYRFREITRNRAGVLSQREREVLVGIVDDKSNADIARNLGVSEHTVETYVRRCFVKLDVTNRTQAALRYLGGGAFDTGGGQPL